MVVKGKNIIPPLNHILAFLDYPCLEADRITMVIGLGLALTRFGYRHHYLLLIH